MKRRQIPTRLRLSRRTTPTTGVELEYFCRGCKGHFSRTLPINSLRELACRCGSTNLLVYSMASEIAAPLRAS